jgi:hypothetical protein
MFVPVYRECRDRGREGGRKGESGDAKRMFIQRVHLLSINTLPT